jgi:general secretion pathway protein C
MKRLPLIAGFVLFIALCVSAAYWAMQLFKPAVRPVAAPPPSKTEPRPEAAAGLFGGRATGNAVASNFELRGVVVAGTARDSIAILASEGKPPQAVRVDTEIMPGVKVTEVHPRYVMLIEGGVVKRIELPENAEGLGGNEGINVPRTPIPVPATQPMPSPVTGLQNPQAPAGQQPQVTTRMPPASQPAVQSNVTQPAAPQPGVTQPQGNMQVQPDSSGVYDPNNNPNLAPGQQAPANTQTQTPATTPPPAGIPGGGHPGLIER